MTLSKPYRARGPRSAAARIDVLALADALTSERRKFMPSRCLLLALDVFHCGAQNFDPIGGMRT
jgi:hypothetical protein